MDNAVLAAYGWTDIDLAHNFYDMDYLPENDRTRYTISPDSRKEILKRILQLNHDLYAEEVAAGLHDKKKTAPKKTAQKKKVIPARAACFSIMKFVTQKGAPDIPLEVLEARDDDRLVLFCGAGISRQAGLADFRGLIDQVYHTLPKQMDEQEAGAYKAGYYDRVLELLEHRYYSEKRADKFLVRKKIIEHLTIAKGADLSSHKAILELAKTQSGRVRLVTTNVDQGFVLVDPAQKPFVDSAPKLPVPKPHKWYSLVHLHGIIADTTDPDGEHFVFTSGDFGTAYLTERWASRFIGELFRNYIVLL